MLRVIEDYLGRIRQAKVVRLDAEDLAIELLKSIRNTGDTEAFYHQFFGYDAILVDNIWVLQSKPRTTKEILTFFETLVDRGRLLVIVWDFAPEILLEGTKEIKKLQERSVIVKMKPYRPSCQLGNGIRRG